VAWLYIVGHPEDPVWAARILFEEPPRVEETYAAGATYTALGSAASDNVHLAASSLSFVFPAYM